MPSIDKICVEYFNGNRKCLLLSWLSVEVAYAARILHAICMNSAVYCAILGSRTGVHALHADMSPPPLRLLVTVTWRCPTTRPLHCDYFWSVVRHHLSSDHSLFIHQSSLVVAEIHCSEAGSWREMTLNWADVVSLSYYPRFLTCRKILLYGF
jgi:hypothetical protein